jgi:hypothetical protein
LYQISEKYNLSEYFILLRNGAKYAIFNLISWGPLYSTYIARKSKSNFKVDPVLCNVKNKIRKSSYWWCPAKIKAVQK